METFEFMGNVTNFFARARGMLAATCTVAALAACGFNDTSIVAANGSNSSNSNNASTDTSGNGTTTTATKAVTGTVAKGAPLALADVTLYDATGKQLATGKTDVHGYFTLGEAAALAAATEPLLLKGVKAATTTGGTALTLYSVGTKAMLNGGGMNVNDITNTIAMLAAQGDPENLIKTPALLQQADVAKLAATAQNLFKPLLSAKNLSYTDPTQLISKPMAADGTGLDAVLDLFDSSFDATNKQMVIKTRSAAVGDALKQAAPTLFNSNGEWKIPSAPSGAAAMADKMAKLAQSANDALVNSIQKALPPLVVVTVSDTWSNGYSGSIALLNATPDTWSNWGVDFRSASLSMTSFWNAQSATSLNSLSDEFRFAPPSWSNGQSVAPNSQVSFGFVGSGDYKKLVNSVYDAKVNTGGTTWLTALVKYVLPAGAAPTPPTRPGNIPPPNNDLNGFINNAPTGSQDDLKKLATDAGQDAPTSSVGNGWVLSANAVGNQWWSTVTITITNGTGSAQDLKDATLSIKSPFAISGENLVMPSPVSAVDPVTISDKRSVANSDSSYTTTYTLKFPSAWTPVTVANASSNIQLSFGIAQTVDTSKFKLLGLSSKPSTTGSPVAPPITSTNPTTPSTPTTPGAPPVVATGCSDCVQPVTPAQVAHRANVVDMKVKGWGTLSKNASACSKEAVLEMGAVQLPQLDVTSATLGAQSRVNAIFKYAGEGGNGDPGLILWPATTFKTAVQSRYEEAVRNDGSRIMPTMVIYTAEASGGGAATKDILDEDHLYKHFVNLIREVAMLQSLKDADHPSPGSVILNPDLWGALQQNNGVNGSYKNADGTWVTVKVRDALTRAMQYVYAEDAKLSNPSWWTAGLITGTGSTAAINLSERWRIMADPTNSNLDATAMKLRYLPSTQPALPTALTNDLLGWVQATNWVVRTFAPDVSYGWQINLWAQGTSLWVHGPGGDRTKSFASDYSDLWRIASGPVAGFFESLGIYAGAWKPDYITFDKYEYDSFASAASGIGYTYDGHDFLNYLKFVQQLSDYLKVPAMLWQLPGGHLVTAEEERDGYPNLFEGGAKTKNYSIPLHSAAEGTLVFGDERITSLDTLSTTMKRLPLPPALFNAGKSSIGDYLAYASYDWTKGTLQTIIDSNVFAILWGGGQTTSVIPNGGGASGNDDGWLAKHVSDYYNTCKPLTQ